jgi:hypothetical protein
MCMRIFPCSIENGIISFLFVKMFLILYALAIQIRLKKIIYQMDKKIANIFIVYKNLLFEETNDL